MKSVETNKWSSKEQRRLEERAYIRIKELRAEEMILQEHILKARLGSAYVRLSFPMDPDNGESGVKLQFSPMHQKEKPAKTLDLIESIRMCTLANDDLDHAIPVEIKHSQLDVSRLHQSWDEVERHGGRLVLKNDGEGGEGHILKALAGFHRYEAVQVYRDFLRRKLQEVEVDLEDIEDLDMDAEKLEEHRVLLARRERQVKKIIRRTFYWRIVFYDKDLLEDKHCREIYDTTAKYRRENLTKFILF